MSRIDDLKELVTRKIESEDVAIDLIQAASGWFFFVSALNIVFGFLFLSEPVGLATGIAYGVLAFWLRKGRSVIAAALLAMLSVINVLDRVLIILSGGGLRIVALLVGLYVLVLSVRTVEACVRLPKFAAEKTLRMTEDGGQAPRAASKVKVYGKK